MTMPKFLLNLHCKNAAALSQSSLNEPDNTDSMSTAAQDSRAQSFFHLCAAISTRPRAQLLCQRRREGARLSAETAF